jgi:D-3-phosphoglycerate dehydrogenase
MKILVTCPPMLRQIELFRHQFTEKGVELVTPEVIQTLTEEELIEIVPQCEGWIIGDDPATFKVFEAGKKGKLKAAVKWGVGIDNVDFKACNELGIPITNTPRMFGGEVADLALAYTLALARESHFIDRNVRQGNWIKPTVTSMENLNIGVVGLGDIGLSTIKRLQGFDTKIYAYDPFNSHVPEGYKIEGVYSFPEKVEALDYLILTCSLTPSSAHMINQVSLNRMKDGIKIVNVARGGLIAEKDLIEALKSRKVSAVALDVFEKEPFTTDNELLQYENCIFGSHNGSNTLTAVQRASNRAIELLFGFLEIQ